VRLRVYPDGNGRAAREYDDTPEGAALRYAEECCNAATTLIVEPLDGLAGLLDWKVDEEGMFRVYTVSPQVTWVAHMGGRR